MRLDLIFSSIKNREVFLFLLFFFYISISHFILRIPITFFSLLGSFLFWIFIYSLSLFLFKWVFSFYILLIGVLILCFPYRGINLSVLASIFESNPSESIEFFLSVPYFYFLYIFLYVLSGFLILYYIIKTNFKFSYINNLRLVFFFSFFLISLYKPLKEFIKGDEFSMFNIRAYPVQVVMNISNLTYNYLYQKRELESGLTMLPDWNISAVNPKYDNYVLVIGESMRFDYMSLYGYPIDTTPFLKQVKGIIFDNYISSAPNTQPSLLHSFYARDNNDIKENDHIINLANSAGFKTYWISNQGVLGEYDTVASRVGFSAKEHIFTKKGNYDDSYINDLELLNYFDNYLLSINKSKKNLFVFHLMGSHPDFCMRLDHMPDFYFISQELTCYLETFKQTDLFLKKVIEKLEKLGSYSLIYLSDHGLQHYYTGKNDLSLRIGSEFQESFHVPLIKISSDDTQQTRIEAQRSGMFFINAFAEWLGIEEKSLKLPYLFFSNQIDKEPVKVFDWKKYILFDSLASDSAKK